MILLVVVVVLALAAATFILSYPGVHAIVLRAGVSVRLARVYPGLFDAVFVIACVAAVMLRDARWWARCYAWLIIIVMVAVVGAADAVHAMNVTLPHRTTEGVVAASPWMLVLLGFGLMLTMLRQSRAQHAAAPVAAPAYAAPPAGQLPEVAALPETRALPAGAVAPGADSAGVPGAADADAWPAAQAARSAANGPAETEQGFVPAAAPYEAPAAEPAAEPVAQTPVEPAAEPVAESAADTTAEPVAESAADTTAEPVAEPGAEPTAEPVAETPPVQPVAETMAEPVAEPVAGHGAAYGDSGAADGLAAAPHSSTVPGRVLEDDAPPFATAPFAAVPRLNRVRSSPTPPEDDEDD